MKNAWFFTLLFFSVAVCDAQFQTGTKVISGQLGFSASNNNNLSPTPGTEQRSTQFSTSFSLGRFKSPTVLNAFGIYYGYNHNHNNIGSPPDEQLYNSHNIGAFISSTKFKLLARKFYLSFTGTGGAGYVFSKTSYVANTANYSKGDGYNLYVSGDMGLLYQLNERFLLNATLTNLISLSYRYGTNSNYSGTNVSKTNNTSFNFNSGLNGFSLSNIGVGIRYILK